MGVMAEPLSSTAFSRFWSGGGACRTRAPPHNTGCHGLRGDGFRSTAVGEALAEHMPAARIVSCVRFSEALTPAHAGGPRGREAIRPLLAGYGHYTTGAGCPVRRHYNDGRHASGYLRCARCSRPRADMSAFGQHKKGIDTAPPARATGRIVDAALGRLQHLDDHPHDGAGREELATAPPLSPCKLRNEVLVHPAHISPSCP